MHNEEPIVAWLEKPWDEMTADEIGATPPHQLAMMAQRDLFARHGRLEEWERETRPVLWPELTPARSAADCTCYHTCAENPATACSLSGEWHVHPGEPCPVHLDAPGDR
jgi:hypothetical protein